MSNDQHKAKNPIIFPSVDGLIADALSIVQLEITKIKTKVQSGRSLDSREAKTLQGYIKSLVELSKEDRERLLDMDLANLSDEELKQLAAQQPKRLSGK